MSTKKLLIIQLDGAYFLEETLRVLEKFHTSLKDFEPTVLVSARTYQELSSWAIPLVPGITTDISRVLTESFDLSVNLSLEEVAWDLHGKVTSARKLGFAVQGGELRVPDLWSTFLLTIKANAPFLAFHLQDIYRNILGIKKVTWQAPKAATFKDIVIGNFAEAFMSLDEKERFLRRLRSEHPHLAVRNLLDVDPISDLSHTLFIGPATLESLRLGEAGARGLYLSRAFQGFNLLPHAGAHFVATTQGKPLLADELFPLVQGILAHGRPQLPSEYSLYEVDHENLFGAYLHSLNQTDSAYPFYQAHVVLWNFLLNLFDVNLDVVRCSDEQLREMKEYQKVLTKLIRLHDYALSSVDFVYHECKNENARAEKIDEQLKNLRDIDELMAKISESHPMLRPFLDYYRIRRGQNDGATLAEQIQHTFLTYSEEHHALTALGELFSVTLRKNEVSI